MAIVARVPRRVHKHDAVRRGEVDAEAARARGDEEEARARVARTVEVVDPVLPILGVCAAVDAEIVLSKRPLLFSPLGRRLERLFDCVEEQQALTEDKHLVAQLAGLTKHLH
eukprot:CAMPEP_0206212940 /NCGR_PEP_ID=MMETSP0047_2-20121206/850_1 /ASSEMBLY_ACC=CAM_ASM_000192 /TAXON_ID=195065 /ORGANISM="Chroomonas mesostigmatica_cf, Strain CCMP1168" /LENGTH=111 /DNA_ID=CAMNT_0053635043 /DNA_START=149 /DNA_END=484 /DNA_ORIENTATION=+